jgi:hypothetical protein
MLGTKMTKANVQRRSRTHTLVLRFGEEGGLLSDVREGLVLLRTGGVFLKNILHLKNQHVKQIS